MRLSTRRRDDADVIRARLRALLAESGSAPGWVPGDEDDWDHPVPVARVVEVGQPPEEPPEEPSEEPPDGAALPSGIGRHRAPGPAVRVNPGRRGAWALWAAGVLAAAAVVAWTWLDRPSVAPVADPPAATSPATTSAATPTPEVGEMGQTSSTLIVSVVGQVLHPGLVTVPAGARVADAISAAGGLLPGADAASVNLAAVVTDGEQIAVGVPHAAAASAGAGASTRPVDLNTATVADLDTLPGIGPVLAQRIVEHRQKIGRFHSVDELNDVSGIGPALYARLAGRVTV